MLNFKSILLIISLFLITNCTNNSAMKPEDFKNKEPRLIIEEYLAGNVKAWGLLQNRSGKVTRQFSADLNGKWDGKHLILDEKLTNRNTLQQVKINPIFVCLFLQKDYHRSNKQFFLFFFLILL